MNQTKRASGDDIIETYNANVEQRKIKRQFLMICFALVLLFTGYSSMLLLQSSINIVDGLGATATSVSYSLSVFFGLFFSPCVVRLVGVKWTLLFSEICYLFYVVANCYPVEWFLMIAAVSVGIGEALFWVMVGIIFVHFGQLYHKYTINRTKESCVREFSGIIFSTYQMNPIIGNTVVFAILHFWKEGENTKNGDLYNTTSTARSPTRLNQSDQIATFGSENDRLYYCGANDCQNANLTQQNLGNYRPSDPVALYALIAAFVAIMIAGIILQACVTPNIPVNFISGDTKHEVEISLMKNDTRKKSCDPEAFQCQNKSSFIVSWWKGIKDIFWRALTLNQFLLYTPSIYYGLLVGFSFCEATRTYASCVNGVSQVGVCSIIYAASSGLSAFVFGKVASKFSLQLIIVAAAILDISIYLLCLFWIPTEHSSWIVYLIFVMLGSTAGMWNILTTNMYSESFVRGRELSFTMWSALFSIGFATQFGWSTVICVRGKLYIQIALLFISIICLQILRNRTTIIPKKQKVIHPRVHQLI